MKKEKENKEKRYIIMYYIIISIIGGIGGFISEYYPENTFIKKGENIYIYCISILIFIYIASFIQIIIHESGHLIFGIISGYKFSSFRIGSIVLVRTKEGMRLRKFYLEGTGGQCLMSPPDMKNDSCPYILYNLGGIIVNIITSILAIVLYNLIDSGVYMSRFIVVFIFVGLICTFLNGIPIPIGGTNNDGCNVLNLRKNKMDIKNFWTILKINSLITKGIRLKDIDEDFFIIPEKRYLESTLGADRWSLECSREIDKMNFEKAKAVGQDILKSSNNLMKINKNMLISEVIFCELVGNNSKEYINEIYTKDFKKFLKRSNKYLSVLRMRYAYSLLFNNDEEEAKKYLKSFEKLARNYINKSEVEGERELIEYVNKLYYR